MSEGPADDRRPAEERVAAELQRRPHLMLQLAENALTVAESLRDNSFRNTARFVAALRQTVEDGLDGRRDDRRVVADAQRPALATDHDGAAAEHVVDDRAYTARPIRAPSIIAWRRWRGARASPPRCSATPAPAASAAAARAW